MPDQPRGKLAMQTIAMPADTNANGDIFGGWLMAQMDLGSSVLARTRSAGRVATIAVEAMTFYKPVRVGDIVTIYGEITKEGTTSLTVHTEVWISRILPEALVHKVTEAEFVFVAVDENGKKRDLP